jgi:4-hydroxy-4-methyl-2-oxoglutarate aldolase
MAERKLTGKIAPERILMTALTRPDPDLIAGFRSLGDASGILSDIMDELGITGVLPASRFRPTIAGACIVGRALTVRNIALREHPYEAARAKVNRMAEFEAQPGRVGRCHRD